MIRQGITQKNKTKTPGAVFPFFPRVAADGGLFSETHSIPVATASGSRPVQACASGQRQPAPIVILGLEPRIHVVRQVGPRVRPEDGRSDE